MTFEHLAQHARWDASIVERVYNKAFDVQERREAHRNQEKRTNSRGIDTAPRMQCTHET